MKLLNLISILICLAAGSLVYGQNYKFSSKTIRDGLSQATVTGIVQDRYGFLWFGTQDGLNRFDGYSFKVYRHQLDDTTSLQENWITAMATDSRGRIFLGTNSGFVQYFNPDDNLFRNIPVQKIFPGVNQIIQIVIGQNDQIWLLTNEGLLLIPDPEQTGQTKMIIPVQEIGITRLGLCAEKKLLISTVTGGVLHQNGENRAPISGTGQFGPTSLAFSDSLGRFWFTTRDGRLFRKDSLNSPDRPELILQGYRFRDASVADDGEIWLAADEALIHFNTSTGITQISNDEFYRNGIAGRFPQFLFHDHNNILWIGFLTDGLARLIPNSDRLLSFPSSREEAQTLPDINIWTMASLDDNNFWLGTDAGLLELSLDKMHLSLPQSAGLRQVLEKQVVRNLFISDGWLYIGTDGAGIYRFHPPSGHIEHYPEPQAIRSFYEDQNGILWVGSLTGLYTWDRDRKGFTRYHFQNPVWNETRISLIDQAGEGQIWLGTYGNGLLNFDPRSGQVQQFKHQPGDSSSLSDNSILSVLTMPDGQVWVGTFIGLNRFDPLTQKFSRCRALEMGGDDVVYSLLADSAGHIWISQNNGIAHFDPLRNKSIRNFNMDDGLPNNEFNKGAFYKTKTGDLLFGGITGLVLIKLHDASANSVKPSVVFTDFRIFNQSTGTEHELNRKPYIVLSYDQNYFSLEFAALDYSNPAKNTYSWKMSGLEEQWHSPTNEHRAYYTNMPPGEYEFIVRAANSEGVWNETGRSVRISIVPPFWMTTVFRVFVLLMTILLAVGFYLRRVYVLKKNQRALREEVDRQTSEIREKNDRLLAAQKESDIIFNNISEGLFILSSDLQIGDKYSASLTELLGLAEPAGKSVFDVLQNQLNPGQLQSVREFFELMFITSVDEDTIRQLNPLMMLEIKPLTKQANFADSRFLRLEFSRIRSAAGQIEHLLCTVVEITEEVLLARQLEEKEEQNKRHMEWLFNILHVDAGLLQEFLDSAESELLELEEGFREIFNPDDFKAVLQNAFRTMHLLKGNAALLDLGFFVRKSHDFENLIQKLQNKPGLQGSDFVPLIMRLHEIKDMIKEINSLILRMSEIMKQLRPRRERETKMFFDTLHTMVKNISERLNKHVEMDLENFDPTLVPFKQRYLIKEVIAQFIRNSLVHGIESTDERILLEKPRSGKIKIETMANTSGIELIYSDDGRGLQLDLIRKKALRLALVDEQTVNNASAAEISGLIFLPGLSTAPKIDEYAGRGIGLDVVKAKLNKNNADIVVTSKEGSFCQFNIVFNPQEEALEAHR